MKNEIKYVTFLIGVNCIGINMYCTHIIHLVNNEVISVAKKIHY